MLSGERLTEAPLLVVLFAGVLAGSVHVVAGPDHLAAVAPFAIRRRSWLPGAQWGAGHVIGVGIVTFLAWLLRGVLPVHFLSNVSEQLVGVVLIAIGLWTVRSALRNRVHVHTHEHGGERHTHMHVHHGQDHHEHNHAPFWVGMLHGVAGSSHFLGVLPALALPTQSQAMLYLLGYGAGTIGAMVAFAALMGFVSHRFAGRSRNFYPLLASVAGMAAIFVGVYWLMP